jgi:hypothetical protein
VKKISLIVIGIVIVSVLPMVIKVLAGAPQISALT